MNIASLVDWLVKNLTVVNVLLLIIIFVSFVFIAQSAVYVGEWLQNRHAKSLQIEKFHREESGADLRGLLDDWSELMYDQFNNSEEDNQNSDDLQNTIQDLVKRSHKFASSDTYVVVVSMLQSVYRKKNGDEGYELMIYFSMIVDSLKKDFTGSSSGDLMILKAWLSDFYEKESELKAAHKRVQKEIKKSKKGAKMNPLGLLVITLFVLFILALIFYLLQK